MKDFTVAIPTYNGASRLPLVLDRLLSQINVEGLSWEVIVVDNNSQDNTQQVVEEYQKNWPTKFPLRYCFERQQGLAFARQRGLAEATSPLVGFLDDDNLPEQDWVAAAYRFGENYPSAGAYASQIHGDFEGELPEDFERIQAFFAITERGDQPLLYNNSKKKIMPPGAGLVIRKRAWLSSLTNSSILVGRVGNSMLAGEDTELLGHIKKAGWEIWYNPDMEVTHKIPKERLKKDYLIKLFKGIGLSRHVTRMSDIEPWVKPLLLLAYMANDTRKIIHHLLKHGLKLHTDIVAACEWELYCNSLRSPYFLWKNGYLK